MNDNLKNTNTEAKNLEELTNMVLEMKNNLEGLQGNQPKDIRKIIKDKIKSEYEMMYSKEYNKKIEDILTIIGEGLTDLIKNGLDFRILKEYESIIFSNGHNKCLKFKSVRNNRNSNRITDIDLILIKDGKEEQTLKYKLKDVSFEKMSIYFVENVIRWLFGDSEQGNFEKN